VVERKGLSSSVPSFRDTLILIYQKQILPWDWDIDTQVSSETLAYVGKNLNQTKHNYVSHEDKKIKKEYLLDVNAQSVERVKGDGMNIIDARWIDVSNGLYIDITGLTEIDPQGKPGIVSCKNDHKYRLRDLYPMRESVFEDVPVRIPYAYDRMLVQEYSEKALTTTEYEGYVLHIAVSISTH
jgi:LicD family protein